MSAPTDDNAPADGFFTPRKRPPVPSAEEPPRAPDETAALRVPPSPPVPGPRAGRPATERPRPEQRPQERGAPEPRGTATRPQGPRAGGQEQQRPPERRSPEETMALRVPPPPPRSQDASRSQDAPRPGRVQAAPQQEQRAGARQPGPPRSDRGQPDFRSQEPPRPRTAPSPEETMALRVPSGLRLAGTTAPDNWIKPPNWPSDPGPDPDEEAAGGDTAVAAEEEQETPAAPRRKGGRDRYLDMLRALALVRVVLYHNFSWAWLPLLFPSMGVMFALAGSLMVRSLSRPALTVIRDRLRRLLPPMWLFGAVAFTLWTIDGWGPDSEGHPAWWWGKLAFWVLPISTPPFPQTELPGLHGLMEGSWGEQIGVPLWYLRAYLWYVLLSPLMLKALRRFPLVTVLTPLALAMCSGLLPEDGRIWETFSDFTTFGSCWILGMAHQEGLLKKLPQYVAPSVAPLVMVAGYWYYVSRPVLDPTEIGDLENFPIAQAVWSFGFVLLLLHLSPSWEQWPRRLEPFNGLISLLNARAVSVYLWHTLALELSVPVIDQLYRVDYLSDHWGAVLGSNYPQLFVAIPLLALFVVTFGWMEDLAAKRSLRLFPYPRKPRGRRRAAL
ncbi:acyltransferase family protein [Kitasatospora sp. NBC_01539]|uniref:acyltransferase family protein n=1 Tax=Kitasatospora sp. NBC_01539 TaxID=2903577 RepID=UPI0038601E29